jgi:hypothetical protein
MRTPVALVATVAGVLIGFAPAAPAIAWITEEAPRVDRPAVVFDIDDTALSNWEVIKANDFGRVIDGPAGAVDGNSADDGHLHHRPR